MEKYKLASESRGNEMKKTVNGAELNCVTVGSGSPVLVMHGGLGLRWVLTEVESVRLFYPLTVPQWEQPISCE